MAGRRHVFAWVVSVALVLTGSNARADRIDVSALPATVKITAAKPL